MAVHRTKLCIYTSIFSHVIDHCTTHHVIRTDTVLVLSFSWGTQNAVSAMSSKQVTSELPTVTFDILCMTLSSCLIYFCFSSAEISRLFLLSVLFEVQHVILLKIMLDPGNIAAHNYLEQLYSQMVSFDTCAFYLTTKLVTGC